MATNINTLKNWFKTGLKPTQAQFWAWLDSYWHKDEEIPQSAVSNLSETLNAKAEKSQLDGHLTDLNAHADLFAETAKNNDVLHKTGNITETVNGNKNFTDTTRFGNASGDNQLLWQLPGQNDMLYKETSGLDYDVKTSPENPNSFFWKNNEGIVHQSFYLGDGDKNNNIFNISASQNSGALWQSSLSANAGGLVGINNSNPVYNSDTYGINRTRGAVNSDTEISISPTDWTVFYTSPDLGTTLQQGYSYDGTYNYNFGTNRIAKFSNDYGTLIANNPNPLSGISGGVDHVGDGCYLNGFLYLPIENSSLAPTTLSAQKIGKYDASTLNLVTTYDVSAQNPSGASITTDGSILYVFEYYGVGNRILKYSLTGLYLGSIVIANPLPFIQGASFYNGQFYVSDQENMYTISLDGSTTKFLRIAPSDPALLHRAEGIQIVNGEIRIVCAKSSGTNFNVYYLNPLISPNKKFKADVLGNMIASSIKFPLVKAPISDVNTLDDYEEGIFTPKLEGLTTAGVGTYSIQSGFFTKIGRLVSAQLSLTWSAHTGTGDMIIRGLPFIVNLVNAQCSIYGNNLTLSANNYISGFAEIGTTQINIRQTPTGTMASATVPMDTNASLTINVTYMSN